MDFARPLRQNPYCPERRPPRIVPELDQKTRMATFGIAVRHKLQLNSAHPDLHKWLYVLCVPCALFGVNGILYYFFNGSEARWPIYRGDGAAWAADTYVAPWLSLLANFGASVLFVLFVRHKRVRRSSQISMAAVLSAAWLCTLIAFLVVE